MMSWDYFFCVKGKGGEEENLYSIWVLEFGCKKHCAVFGIQIKLHVAILLQETQKYQMKATTEATTTWVLRNVTNMNINKIEGSKGNKWGVLTMFNPLGVMCIYVCTCMPTAHCNAHIYMHAVQTSAYHAELHSQTGLQGKSLPIE